MDTDVPVVVIIASRLEVADDPNVETDGASGNSTIVGPFNKEVVVVVDNFTSRVDPGKFAPVASGEFCESSVGDVTGDTDVVSPSDDVLVVSDGTAGAAEGTRVAAVVLDGGSESEADEEVIRASRLE